jgi:hypothetical protein
MGGTTVEGHAHVPAKTRFGEKDGHNIFMEKEERFRWQKVSGKADCFYDVPTELGGNPISFGNSTRSDWESTRVNKRDIYNPNAGPASYTIKNEAKLLSTMRTIRGGPMGNAKREGMGTKTIGPGPAYDITGIYRNGPSGKKPVSFGKDKRKPLHSGSGVDAIYVLKFPKSPGVKISPLRKAQSYSIKSTTPGPIYDVDRTFNFKTGPTYSFGASKAPRFDKRSGL